jgi:hypothetical protein
MCAVNMHPPQGSSRHRNSSGAFIAIAMASCVIALFVAELIVGATRPQLTYSRAQLSVSERPQKVTIFHLPSALITRPFIPTAEGNFRTQ